MHLLHAAFDGKTADCGVVAVEEDAQIERQFVEHAFQKDAISFVTRADAPPATVSNMRNPSEANPFRTHSMTSPRSSHSRSAARRLRMVKPISRTARSWAASFFAALSPGAEAAK